MEEEESKKLHVAELVKCVVVGLIGVVCIVGNILVIRALIFSKYPKIPIYIVIGAMAVTDLLKVVMEIPDIIFEVVGEAKISTTAWCKAHFYLVSVSSYTAAAYLVLFSIIRCIMLNDRVHSRSYVKHTVIGCIIISIGISCSNLLNLKSVEKSEIYEECVELGSALTEEDERNMWLRFAFSYIIPLLVIVVLYILTKFLSMRFFEESYSSRERRFSCMVTMLVVTFAIFKLPYEIINVMMFYKTRETINSGFSVDPAYDPLYDQLNTLFEIDKYCSSVALIDLGLRPLIYAKFSYYFGNSFDEVINCSFCQNKSHPRRRRKTDSGMSTQEPLHPNAEEIFTDEKIGDKNNDQEYPENGLQFEEEEEEENEEEDSKCPISIFINDDSEGMYIGSICDEKNGMILGVCEKIYLFNYFETCLKSYITATIPLL